MTLWDFIKVYDKHEPLWINYPDDVGCYDADYYGDKGELIHALSSIDDELIYWADDEIDYITHGEDGMLTVELKYNEGV